MSLFTEYSGIYNMGAEKIKPQIFDYTGKKITVPELFIIAEIMGDITVIGGTFVVPVMLMAGQTRVEFYGTTFESFVEDNLGTHFYGCTFNADLDIDCHNSFLMNSEINGETAFKNAHNCVIFRSRIKAENPVKFINSRFITIAESNFSGSGGVQIDASANLLFTGNSGDCAGKPEILMSSDRYEELQEAAEAGIVSGSNVFSEIPDAKSPKGRAKTVISSTADLKNALEAKLFDPAKLKIDTDEIKHEIYGNDSAAAAYNLPGAESKRLPPVDTSRFFRMPVNDTMTYEGKELTVDECIKEAVLSGKHEIIIHPGIYRVKANADSDAHIVLDGVSDFTVYAYGVFIIFEDYTKTAIKLVNCKNFCIKGLTTDYYLTAGTQLTVKRTDSEYAYLETDSYYPDMLDNEYFYPQTDRKALYFTKYSDRPAGAISGSDFSPERTSGRMFRISVKSGLKPEDKIVFRGKTADVNRFINCSDIVYEDVTVYGGSGYGIFEKDGDGGTLLKRTSFIPGPKPYQADFERMVSLSGAVRSVNMKRGIRVENSIFRKSYRNAVEIFGVSGTAFTFENCLFNGSCENGITVSDANGKICHCSFSDIALSAVSVYQNKNENAGGLIIENNFIYETGFLSNDIKCAAVNISADLNTVSDKILPEKITVRSNYFSSRHTDFAVDIENAKNILIEKNLFGGFSKKKAPAKDDTQSGGTSPEKQRHEESCVGISNASGVDIAQNEYSDN